MDLYSGFAYKESSISVAKMKNTIEIKVSNPESEGSLVPDSLMLSLNNAHIVINDIVEMTGELSKSPDINFCDLSGSDLDI
jgi:hypothetical protein